MKAFARGYVWWPALNADLEKVTGKCKECLAHRNRPPQITDAKWPTPSEPWYRLHVDFAGPFQGKMLLVIVDATSKWPEVLVMASTSTDATVDALRTVFARFGLPVEIVSDNGPQFTSEKFAEFTRRNGIKHIMGAPYHPQTNGLAGRMVQSVKKALQKGVGQEEFNLRLSRYLLRYRKTPHPTTGRSPASVLFGRPLRSRIDLLKPPVGVKRSSEPTYSCGQRVFVIDSRPGQQWQEAIVEKKIGALLYLVRVGNTLLKRHINQMMPCARPASPEQPETQEGNSPEESEEFFDPSPIVEEEPSTPTPPVQPAIDEPPSPGRDPSEPEPRRSGRARRQTDFYGDRLCSIEIGN